MNEEFLSSQSNDTQHDVDAIIANAYGTPNPGEKTDTSLGKQEAPAPAQPQYKEYEFNSRGQAVKIKDNDPRLQQWLSLGHDYSQQMTTLRQEREQWEKQRGDWEKNWGTYREIDEFAKQNPQWWEHLNQSYQQKLQNPLDIPDHVRQYLDPIVKDYSEVKTFIQDYQKQQIEKQNAEADTQLNSAIKSIQEKYPNLDFKAVDESGYSLEKRVLDHAMQNGFPTFRAAFLDYYHDHLEKLAEARGKESMMSEMKKRQKMGLLDETQAPNPSQASLIPKGKPRSWNDPTLSGAEILRELNIT